MEKKFNRTTYPNGLEIISENHSQFNTVCIGFWIKVGSRFESERMMGSSHLIEHMLFKGTEKRSALDIVREVEQKGGDFNAFTEHEVTCFHVTVLKKDLELAVDILSDIILNSTFHSEEYLREQGVVLQEIAMYEDSPEDHINDLFLNSVWKGNSLSNFILGTKENLPKINRDEIFKFYKDHYRPEITLVSAAGSIEHNELVDLLEKYYLKNADSLGDSKVKKETAVPAKFQSGLNVFTKDICQYKRKSPKPLELLAFLPLSAAF